MKTRLLLSLFIVFFFSIPSFSQISVGDDNLDEIDYTNPRMYEIGGITISGIQYIDNNTLITLSGLSVGQKIKVPGDDISKSIKKLWDQGLFENIIISATKIKGEMIFLNIHLTERPRLSKFSFTGIRKGEKDKIRDEIKLTAGDVITENIIQRTTNKIKKYYVEKGFLNCIVDIVQKKDTTKANNVILTINIQKNEKVGINKISVIGNKALSEDRIKFAFKDTKETGAFDPFAVTDSIVLLLPHYLRKLDSRGFGQMIQRTVMAKIKPRIFKSSKFIEEDYTGDKIKLIDQYNEMGYRDARILKDSIYPFDKKSINIDVYVQEGHKYYFRNITWVGNTKYSSNVLNAILRVKKGDVYDQKLLDANLSFNQNSMDVSSLYMDDGYLFFNVEPVEVRVENDSIDLEIRIREGKQARINKVTVKGNTKTNDHVVIREIRTRPGQLFSRTDIIRTTRELAQLRYFDAEKINPVPKPNPADGTVDIEYQVQETSSDQIELSGGWGYGTVVGTLGVSFNNFSLRKFFDKSAWTPIPSGDGQKLSVRFQSTGAGFLSYNVSFTEPWLGGKKPNSLSVTYMHSLYTNGLAKSDTNRAEFKINGFIIGLGKRLTWPDDYFSLYHTISLQRYDLKKYTGIFTFSDGYSNNFSYGISLSRNSVDAPIFPRSGSEVTLSLQATPPYSLFSSQDFKDMPDQQKWQWNEYHKWKFSTSWYSKLYDNFVLSTRIKTGFLANYNPAKGTTPFERFYIGGDGLSGMNNMDGRELVGLRGYANETVTPNYYQTLKEGGTIFAKYTLELRYPISLNPNATIFALSFIEAGNAWLKFDDYNPFDMKRSAGLGVRIFLPMFGLLGLDWGYGFDNIPGIPGANHGQFHFSINQSID